MNKKQIRKMQTAAGGPLFPWQEQNTEWVDNWKFRTTPASRSRVLSGKGVETPEQYTTRRKQEETKRTWRSDAADVAHGIGEGVLALHPYTAIPYFGAKVGQDFLNGTYGWHTALNASVPLFHLSPQINNGITNTVNYSKRLLSKYNPELSYEVNKNKILDEGLLGAIKGQGSESTVYQHGNRVYKVSNSGSNNVSDIYRYMKSRLRRNKGPYALKENIEGVVQKEGKYYPVTSQKYYEPNNSFYPSKETQQIQDQLMQRKGYYRVPIEDIPNLPGVSVINIRQPMYFNSQAFRSMTSGANNYSQVFSNGYNYILDNRLGTNSILTKNWLGKYKLVQRDNDVIPLFGESRGYFPMGDKVFNPNISENTYTPEQMENFKKLFIQRWKQ